MLHVPAELEKGHRDRVLALAPEFGEFLELTPAADRRGRVFRPLCKLGEPAAPYTVSRMIALIGRKANVKVHTHPTKGTVKYASAHDLRRSFGERWSHRVMPPDLMQLMRHESINTTLRFYVGRNAQTTADSAWDAYRKTQAAGLGTVFGTVGHDRTPDGAVGIDRNH
ncbi:MAG: site-specific integrase [Planctomycetia bacterium]|nr:site-specific integrase [Planctomycetia bacterium]